MLNSVRNPVRFFCAFAKCVCGNTQHSNINTPVLCTLSVSL